MVSAECGWRPGSCGVAGRTICAKLTKVFHWLGMAGNAGRLCADKYIIDMAIFATDSNMRARQREIAQAVVEGNSIPIFRCVAGFTLSSKLTLMFILLKMTGIAILRGRLQIYNAASIEMASGTGCFCMTAN